MENEKIEIRTGKNWWLLLILGILYAAIGFWVLFKPGVAYEGLTIFLIVAFVMGGIFEITYALCNTQYSGWGWSLASGIITFVLGALLMANFALAAAMLPFLLGFAILFRGMTMIGVSSEMKHFGIKGWGWTLTGGIVAIILSLLMMINLGFGAAVVIYLTAFAFLVVGLALIMFSLQVKSVRSRADDFVNKKD